MKNRIISTLFSLSLFIAVNGQTTLSAQLEENLKTYFENYQREVVYLDVSVEEFLPGNYFPFEVYLTGATKRTQTLSNVVYIDIIGPDCSPLLFEKVNVQNGFAKGSIQIPYTLTSGFYSVRAYTQWTKEVEPDFIFEKIMKVGNPAFGAPQAVEFYPEYGKLYHGLNDVVIKTLSGVKKGVPTAGFVQIFNAEDKQIGSASTNENGYARIKNLQLESGVNYYARLGNSSEKWSLPMVENKSALAFTITSSGDEGNGLDVATTVLNTTGEEVSFYLASQQGGNLGSLNKYLIRPGEQKRLMLNEKILEAGFNEISLLAEDFSLIGSKAFYLSPKERADVSFDYLDFHLASSFVPNYSMEEMDLNDKEALRTFIDAHTRYQLDYQSILEGNDVTSTEKELGLSLSGKVTLKRKIRKKDSLSLSVLVQGTSLSLIEKNIPLSGEFDLKAIHYNDTTPLVVSIKGLLSKDFEVTFEEKPFQNRFLSVDCRSGEPVAMDSSMLVGIELDEDAVLLDEVVVDTKRDDPTQIYSSNFVSKSIDLEDGTEGALAASSGSILEYLNIKLPGSRVLRNNFTGQIVGFVLGGTGVSSLSGPGTALIILDGVQISAEAFNTFSTSSIGKIDVLEGPQASVYGSRAGNGVIVAYSASKPIRWNRQKSNTYYLSEGYLTE